MRKKVVKITFVGIILSIGLLSIYHFKRDIFNYPIEYYVLESDTSNVGKTSRRLIVLLSHAPYLENNIKKCLEEAFWKHVYLDTLHFYDVYSVRYYRETKYLTRNFKEGNQYVPLYSHWDNTMDWRNHFKDELGEIMFCKREDGTGFYNIIINDTGYGFHIFADIVKRNTTYQDFNDIKDFYIRKCKELGLEKDDIENNEKY